MFSNLSFNSISLATVTPSLVMRGAPKDLSRTTFRPFGPSVTFTASARMFTPLSIRVRASVPNFTSLAAIDELLKFLITFQKRWCAKHRSDSADNAEDVAFLHDQQVFT